MTIADIAGSLGAILILAGFAYANILKRPPDLIFNGLNLIGAALLAVSVYINFNLPVLLLELAWVMIAIYGIVSLLIARRKAAGPDAEP